MKNLLTIDVEDYYQVSAFEPQVPYRRWPEYESRVMGNTCRLLEMLAFYRVRATFFTLGWIAERHPTLVRLIVQHGHELASHGYRHQRISNMTRDEFRQDVERAKGILEDCAGQPVVGFRAPSFSIMSDTLWALDILEETGHQYDSSIFPIHHDLYGMPGAARFPSVYRLSEGRRIVEVPPSTVRLGRWNLPVAGGGYFRIFPYWYTQWGIRKINLQEKQPAVFYLHPWEIDPRQPRLAGPLRSRLRHYTRLDQTENNLRWLLTDFQFGTVSEYIAGLESADGAAVETIREVAHGRAG